MRTKYQFTSEDEKQNLIALYTTSEYGVVEIQELMEGKFIVFDEIKVELDAVQELVELKKQNAELKLQMLTLMEAMANIYEVVAPSKTT